LEGLDSDTKFKRADVLHMLLHSSFSNQTG